MRCVGIRAFLYAIPPQFGGGRPLFQSLHNDPSKIAQASSGASRARTLEQSKFPARLCAVSAATDCCRSIARAQLQMTTAWSE